MKTNDLRIGNLVKFYPINGTNTYEVFAINKEGYVSLNNNGQIASCSVKDIEPIELTEEVLEKIVGVKVVDLDYNKTRLIGTNYHFNDCMVSLIYKGDKYHTQLISSRYRVSLDVKHLHQLQNAYYLLTGQELNIEL